MTISRFEVVAMLITLASIYLATKQSIWYYPTGVVAVVMYSWIYYEAKLYAEALLQIIWFGLMVYGWYKWLHGGANRDELRVSRTPGWAWRNGILAGIVVSALAIWIQLNYTDNPNPYVDSSLLAWNLVAQWMTARKWIESWPLWLVINTISIPLYIVRELWPTVVLYLALWILAIVGYRQWRRSLVPACASV